MMAFVLNINVLTEILFFRKHLKVKEFFVVIGYKHNYYYYFGK
jgi:hypothetical protein